MDDTTGSIGGCGLPLTVAGQTMKFPPIGEGAPAAGDLVTVQLRGITNPSAPGPKALAVTLGRSRSTVLGYQITPPTGVTHVFFRADNYAPGARTNWEVGFVAPGAMDGGAWPSGNSEIILKAPAGTVFPAFSGCGHGWAVVVPVDQYAQNCISGTVTAGGSEAMVSSPSTSAGALVSISIFGVKNPARGSLTIWTTSDPVPATVPVAHVTALRPSVQLAAGEAGADPDTLAAEFDLRTGFVDGKTMLTLRLSGASATSGGWATSGYVLYNLTTGRSAGAAPGIGSGTCTTPKFVGGPVVPLCETIGGGGIGAKPGDDVAVTSIRVADAPSPGWHDLNVSVSTGTTVSMAYKLRPPAAVRPVLAQLRANRSPARGSTLSVSFRATGALTGFGPMSVLGGVSAVHLRLPGATWPGGGGFAVNDDTYGVTGGNDFGAGGAVTSAPGSAVGYNQEDIGNGDLVTLIATPLHLTGSSLLSLSTTSNPSMVNLPVTRLP